MNVAGSLEGSHVAPVSRVQWLIPSSSLAGNAVCTPNSITASSKGPGFNLSGSCLTSNPNAEQARNANTQVGPAADVEIMLFIFMSITRLQQHISVACTPCACQLR